MECVVNFQRTSDECLLAANLSQTQNKHSTNIHELNCFRGGYAIIFCVWSVCTRAEPLQSVKLCVFLPQHPHLPASCPACSISPNSSLMFVQHLLNVRDLTLALNSTTTTLCLHTFMSFISKD